MIPDCQRSCGVELKIVRMVSRRYLLVGFSCAALMLAVAAFQVFPVGAAISTAIARLSAQASTTATGVNNAVWAKVPYCGCFDSPATDNVSAALKKAQLAATVKILSPTGGWMYFVVAFDPKTATHDQIAAAIVAGGGEVVAGPP